MKGINFFFAIMLVSSFLYLYLTFNQQYYFYSDDVDDHYFYHQTEKDLYQIDTSDRWFMKKKSDLDTSKKVFYYIDTVKKPILDSTDFRRWVDSTDLDTLLPQFGERSFFYYCLVKRENSLIDK